MNRLPISLHKGTVCQILSGTQTALLVPIGPSTLPHQGLAWRECLCAEIDPTDVPCITCEARFGESRLGAPGDVFWVPERWALKSPTQLQYGASLAEKPFPVPAQHRAAAAAHYAQHRAKVKHASTMPEWAARLCLEVLWVTHVPAWEISRAQAKMLGFFDVHVKAKFVHPGTAIGGGLYARDMLEGCWNRDYEQFPWETNPWVRIYTIRPLSKTPTEKARIHEP